VPTELIWNELIGLALNGLLGLGSYWIVRYGLRQPRGLAAGLGTALVFWIATTLGLEVLDAVGAIALAPMLAWAGLIAGVGGVVRWLRTSSDQDRHKKDEPATAWSWDARVCLALWLTAALGLGMRSLLLAVKVVSDGPIYHLYFAARWWKAGRLILVAAPFGENAATYFPANGDLWFTWLMASWGGDRLAKIGQAPFLILAALAAFGCARLVGAGRSASLVATCCFASSTPLLLFSFEPNVDTIFVAGYLLAAYFFLRFARGQGDISALVLGALAAGEALGTKAVGIVFIAPLIALAIGGTLAQSGPARTKVVRALVIGLFPLVSGGYWFIRNGLLTDNPLYPLEVRVLGRTLLSGWYGPEAMQTSPYYLPLTDWRALGDILLAVLDPRLAPLWIVSLAAGWTMKGSTPSRTLPFGGCPRRWAAIFALMAVLNVVLYWVCIPYRTQQRFMLQALGLAVVPLAVTLDRRPWLRGAAVFLVGLHLLTPETWPFATREEDVPWDLTRSIPNAVGSTVPLFSRIELALRAPESQRTTVGVWSSAAMGLVAVLMVWAWNRRSATRNRPRRRRAFALVATATFLALSFLDLWLSGFDSRFRFFPPFPDFYRGWLQLDSWSGPTGSRVAYAGTNIPYYLLGNGLRNEVRYINIDRHRDWLLHDYHREARALGEGNWPNSRPGWDRIQPDFPAWLDNLAAERIELLVVTRVNPAEGAHNVADAENFPIERQWAESHPERFKPLYGQREHDPWFRLFQVRPFKPDRASPHDPAAAHRQVRPQP
jgi:Dolichyl-phosphate-mannose-protein mannosyltransferase